MGAAFWHWPAPAASFFSEERAVVALGARLYAERCALCHGGRLQGQAGWRSPRADGKMPAPPLNSDGHAWHHDSATLLGIVEQGLVPPWAPPGYRSDMPGFEGRLSDEEIRAVLSFVAESWNAEARAWQSQIEARARPQ